MLGFLNQPYKERYSKKAIVLTILFIGLLIHLFLLLLIPFGISPFRSVLQFIISFGYTLVSAFVVFILYFFINPIINKEKWNIGKSIIWELFIIFCIALANLFYHFLIYRDRFYADFSFKSSYFIFFGWGTLLIIILLLIIHYGIYFKKKHNKSLFKATFQNKEGITFENDVIIKAGNKKNNFVFNPKSILFISSNDNYVSVSTINGDHISRIHIRGTLKGVESDLKKNSQFVRCHKCFIVNLKFVDRATGNIQNLKLVLNQSGIEVPVSRSCVPSILKKIGKG